MKNSRWTMPEWMKSYLSVFPEYAQTTRKVNAIMNRRSGITVYGDTNVEVATIHAVVECLTRLHDKGLFK